MERTVTTTIDADLCIGCGSCVAVCPSDTLTVRGGKAEVTGAESLNCGHCEAVCPSGAIEVGALSPSATRYATFEANRQWLPHGGCDVSELVRLMASRRSCRNFAPTPVGRDALEDLVKIGATAPSGTNSQQWSFTILPDRQAVRSLGRGVMRFYKLLNALAERRSVRLLTRLAGKRELQQYYEQYYEKIKEGIAEFERGGRERLFHEATAAILVGSLEGATCPAEDALLATQNILLAAHAMGLGTCLIGFAVHAIRQDPRLPRILRLNRGERVHTVIALGYPDEQYERVAGRGPVPIRVWPG